MPATADHAPAAAGSVGSHLRRLFWYGVLPEALGLCFVTIIFGGFAAAYFTADQAWKRQALTMRQAEAEILTRSLATMLGNAVGSDDASVENLLQQFTQLPRVRSVRWTTGTGQPRFSWPPGAGGGAERAALVAEGPNAVASAPVRTAGGDLVGTLAVETATATGGEYRATLVWNWGIAAGATLLVFAVLYHRLRRHLRPVAAIERNLHSYASGLEHELATLTLSDSLGSVARGWNQLIDELTRLQRQAQSGPASAPTENVLARFEQARFRRVVERLPGGVLCVGDSHVISYANGAAAALLGRAVTEIVGRAVPNVIEDPAVMQAVLGVQARPGASLTVDHASKEGDRETSLRFRVLSLAEQGTGELLITIEDISQLREDQRARDNFLYHVTHELRTPLTSIHAYAETLTKPGFDDEQTRKECYNVIISETRRLSNLVENILSISQLEVGTARLDVGEVDLVRLTRQMVQDNLGAADQKKIDLTLTLPPKVPKLRGDKQRLSVLLTNLIGNAIKYTQEGGRVQVSVDVAEQCLRLIVADTGIGIAPDDQAHVFDKFYRATNDYVQTTPGTGLGLAIAREVARLHAGEIRLASEPGKGSTFTVELPLANTDRTEVGAR